MEVKYLQEEEVFVSIISRLDQIKPDTQPKWGSMNAAQLFAHLAEVQEVFIGKELKQNNWFIKLLAPLIKKGVLSTKPYPKNSRTHPQYLISDTSLDFDQEKVRLYEALHKFKALTNEESLAKPHALFGKLSLNEKGWAAYKHMVHHLEQFGV